MADELSPHETERVRRLLADARHTEPIPDDVAARIDRALADAAVETSENAGTASVVPLPERRRNAGRLLLAAAAVVVGGVAVGQVVGGGSDGNEAGDSSTAASESAPDQEQLPAPNRDDQLQDRGNIADSQADGTDGVPGSVSDTRRSVSKLAPRQIRSSQFAADAQRLRPLATGRRTEASYATAPDAAALSARETCAAGAWGGGRYVRVAFGREAGWLVYRAPRGGTQVVDLFLCGEESPERSATLPLR